MTRSIAPFFGSHRHLALWLVASAVFIACTDGPASSSPGNSKTDAGDRLDAGTGGRGSGGASSSGGRTTIGGGGSVATGGSGGSAGAGASPGSRGSSGKSCICPAASPVSGGTCPAECEAHQCTYEDCAGAGFTQAACAGGSWFNVVQACGNKPCVGSPAPLSCGPGFVCMLIAGGAVRYECRAHGCGKGPITCDCLTEPCAGQCYNTGANFTCNTCPSATCP